MKLAMLDIETLSSRNNAMVLSIACIAFEAEVPYLHPVPGNVSYDVRIGHTFSVNLDLQWQQEVGRHIDPKTVIWWSEQSEHARNMAFQPVERVGIPDALFAYANWIKEEKPEAVYAWPSTFDHVVMQSLHDDFGAKNPVHYRDQLCMRTVASLANVECPALPAWLVEHDPVHDCVRQIIWLQAMFKSLGIYQEGGDGLTHESDAS